MYVVYCPRRDAFLHASGMYYTKTVGEALTLGSRESAEEWACGEHWAVDLAGVIGGGH
jgi:hypothetical protein